MRDIPTGGAGGESKETLEKSNRGLDLTYATYSDGSLQGEKSSKFNPLSIDVNVQPFAV